MPTATAPPRRRSALVKSRIWPKIGYSPHEGQALIHGSTARHQVADCGRRFGKSKCGGLELIPDAMLAYTRRQQLEDAGEQVREWIVGPNYDDCEREFRVFWDACRKLKMPMDKPGSYYDARTGNMTVSLWDGRWIVECRSAAHPESLDGEGLSRVLMVEAAKLKGSVWNKFIRPALADKRGSSLWTSTPEGKNHFYDAYRLGQDPNETAWQSWKMPSWMNTAIFPKGRQDPEILSMESDMTEPAFNQEIGAEFSEFVGRVFPDYDEDVHVGNFPYNPNWPLYAACDYGWTNPFVWLLIQIDVFDNVYVIGEYRCVERDTTEIADTLRDDFMDGLSKKVKMFYPDPAAPSDTNILANQIRIHPGGGTGGELKFRLEYIREWLKLRPDHVPVEEREPKLFIDRSCVGNPLGDGGLIREMDEYRYPEKKEEADKSHPENPMDKDDHGPEALGRFFRGYFGDPSTEHRGTKVSNANILR